MEYEPHAEIVNKFLEECNPYIPSEPLDLDLRKYLKYAEENNVRDPSEISEEVLQQFKLDRSREKVDTSDSKEYQAERTEREDDSLDEREKKLLKQGRMEAREEDTIVGIERAIRKQMMSLEEAMDYMDIPRLQQPRFIALMREKQEGNFCGYTAD